VNRSADKRMMKNVPLTEGRGEGVASVEELLSWLLFEEERFVEMDLPRRTGSPQADDGLPNWAGRVFDNRFSKEHGFTTGSSCQFRRKLSSPIWKELFEESRFASKSKCVIQCFRSFPDCAFLSHGVSSSLLSFTSTETSRPSISNTLRITCELLGNSYLMVVLGLKVFV
jgi:hypothetical protein